MVYQHVKNILERLRQTEVNGIVSAEEILTLLNIIQENQGL